MTPIYGSAPIRATSNNSNSPGNLHGQPSTLLVVPQPINATKMTSGLSNGNGRKYQCKMCPQVRVSCNFLRVTVTHFYVANRKNKSENYFNIKMRRRCW